MKLIATTAIAVLTMVASSPPAEAQRTATVEDGFETSCVIIRQGEGGPNQPYYPDPILSCYDGAYPVVLTRTGHISDIDLPRACEAAGYRLPEEQ